MRDWIIAFIFSFAVLLMFVTAGYVEEDLYLNAFISFSMSMGMFLSTYVYDKTHAKVEQ
jgi:hypothetical protein